MDVRNLLSSEAPSTNTNRTVTKSQGATSLDSKSKRTYKSTGNHDQNADRVSEITSPTISKDKLSPDQNIANKPPTYSDHQLQSSIVSKTLKNKNYHEPSARSSITLQGTTRKELHLDDSSQLTHVPHRLPFQSLSNNQLLGKDLPPIPPNLSVLKGKAQQSSNQVGSSPPCPPTLQLPENIMNCGSPINSQVPTPTDMVMGQKSTSKSSYKKERLQSINDAQIRQESLHLSPDALASRSSLMSKMAENTQPTSSPVSYHHLPLEQNGRSTVGLRIHPTTGFSFTSQPFIPHQGKYFSTIPSAKLENVNSQKNSSSISLSNRIISSQPAQQGTDFSFPESYPLGQYETTKHEMKVYSELKDGKNLKRMLSMEPLSPRKRQRYLSPVTNTTIVQSTPQVNTLSQHVYSNPMNTKPSVLPSPQEILKAQPIGQVPMKYTNGYINSNGIQDQAHLTAFARQQAVGQRAGSTARVRCNICFRTFSGVSSHNRHVSRTHLNSRPFECPTCKLPFGQKGSLDRHVSAVHEKKRPFPCEECGKSFGRKDNLRVHIHTVHLKYKPFQCEFCYRPFGNRRPLRVHLETVHLKLKQLECNICRKRFLRSSQLRTHMQTHSTETELKEKPAMGRPCTEFMFPPSRVIPGQPGNANVDGVEKAIS